MAAYETRFAENVSTRLDAQEAPTSMSDALATKLGLKTYYHGTTYNGGIAPTVSGITPGRASFVPYQVQDGGWRLRFNIEGSMSSSSTATATINGVVFHASYTQAVVTQGGGPVQGTASTNGGGASIGAAFSSAVTGVRLSGDVELASKPTWAY